MTNKTTSAIDLVERDISGETVMGMRVAAYRETHPEHGDKYGHRYSEHWSTPSKDPRVKVERLFTEEKVRSAIEAQSDTITRLQAALERIASLTDEQIEVEGYSPQNIAHNALSVGGE